MQSVRPDARHVLHRVEERDVLLEGAVSQRDGIVNHPGPLRRHEVWVDGRGAEEARPR